MRNNRLSQTRHPSARLRPLISVIVVTLICVAVESSHIAPPSFATTNGGSITALGVPLTENFDTLASAGTSITWTDNSTIPGWYSTRTTYNSGTGSSNTGALYSFGVAGTNPVTDRALGSVASGGTLTVYQAARLTNNTGITIASLDISYVGEQWRNGGNTAAHTLTFQYQVANAGIITGANAPATGWTTFSPLSFTGPVTGSTAALLDGNAPANRIPKSATLAVAVADGQEIWVRWQDLDDSGNDHGLAIDDFSVTATAAGDVAPTVQNTTPANSATNVPVGSNIVVNFSEPVNATTSSFNLQCPSGPTETPFTLSASPASSFTLDPAIDLPFGTVCTMTVTATQITDIDGAPDNMATDYTFSFTTVAADAAPAVTTTSPANGASNVADDSNIVINFNESVTASGSAFSIQCQAGLPQAFTQTGSPATSFTLDPIAALPPNATCTVTVAATQISDTDSTDPPDQMAGDFSFSFSTPPAGAGKVIINEIDADTPGNPDQAEFIELYDGGIGNIPLDGLVVVLYDGGLGPFTGRQSYAAFDLDGYRTDANGYFVLGNPGVPSASIIFDPGPFGLLQNGPDAVALYVGNATDFPNGTNATTTNLLDAIVYGTDDPSPSNLLPLINAGQLIVNENANGAGTVESSQRCPNGMGGTRNSSAYKGANPTPGAANECPAQAPPSGVVISQIYGGGGNTNATYHNDYIELYNRGVASVDLSGWSVQYASSAGSGWSSNLQPLGGAIGAGEYYLIALASGGAVGAQLPAANITGQINMSGTTGKVALSDSFEPLTGNCPLANAHVRDFIGYGTADCGEGATTGPSLTNTSAAFRQGNGSLDTNVNHDDFVAGPPNPRRTAAIVEIGPFVLITDRGGPTRRATPRFR